MDKPQTKDGLYGLRYADFVVPLVKAVQEQHVIITGQQKQIDELKKNKDYLQKQIDEVTVKLAKLVSK